MEEGWKKEKSSEKEIERRVFGSVNLHSQISSCSVMTATDSPHQIKRADSARQRDVKTWPGGVSYHQELFLLCKIFSMS